MDAGPHTLTQYRTGGRMRFIFIVDDAEHDESAGTQVGQNFIIENYEKAELFVDFMQKIEKDNYVYYQILDTDEAIKVNEIAIEETDDGQKLVINPETGERVAVDIRRNK